jgi:hypothetical protein
MSDHANRQRGGVQSRAGKADVLILAGKIARFLYMAKNTIVKRPTLSKSHDRRPITSAELV